MQEITQKRFCEIFPLTRKDNLCLESDLFEYKVCFQTGKWQPSIKGQVSFYKYNPQKIVNELVFRTKNYKELCNFLKENDLGYLLDEEN